MNFKFFYDRSSSYDDLSFVAKATRIVEVSIRRFYSQELNVMSTSLTYYTLFSIVPIMALIFGFTRGFRWEKMLKNELLQRFSDHSDAINWIFQFAERALNQARGGVVAGVGVAALVITVFLLANNIEKAFNQVWILPQRKNIFRKLSDSISILIITPLMLIIASSGGVAVNKTLVGFGKMYPRSGIVISGILPVISSVLPFILSVLVFMIIYKKIPNTKVNKLPALMGGLVGGILYQLFQWAFLFSQTWLSKYNAVYGSFAALPLFLIFLNFSWQILLFGAEFSFICQNIRTGRFDLTGRKYSKWQILRYELVLMRYLLRTFDLGKEPPREEDIASVMMVSPFMVRILLDDLIECNLVREVKLDDDNWGFTPARPPKYITMWFVLKNLLTGGKNLSDDKLNSELEWVNVNCNKLEDAIRENPYNRHLGEI